MAAAISSSDTILLFDRRKLGACDRQTGTRDSIMFYVDDSVGKYMQCVTFSKMYLRSWNGIINHVFICMTCILELSKVGATTLNFGPRSTKLEFPKHISGD